MLAPRSPGPLLRSLRVSRRLSQEELARRAEISARHLSCLESGKAHPSHQMLLILGSALDLPLRSRNSLLMAGGFAPVYRVSPLDAPDMGRVKEAVGRILALHEPHPALVLDRSHNVLQQNRGAMHLMNWCGGRVPEGGAPNAARMVMDRAYGVRDCIVNFEAIADQMMSRLRAEAEVDPGLEEFVAEMARLRGPLVQRPTGEESHEVALPIHLRRGATDLRYFMTLTTLGTPLDVTAQELTIEGYFPLDRATEEFGLRSRPDAG